MRVHPKALDLFLFLVIGALAAAAALPNRAHAEPAEPGQVPGLQIMQVFLPDHDARTRVAVWYPSTGLGEPTLYADNPVFQGVDARVDGQLGAGPYPLVLFSHGLGGTDRAQAWLGAGLARRGAVVAMVNHPNSTWGDFEMSKGIAHWTRAEDISAVLDHLLVDETLSQAIDRTRIMAAGFSYGGWTALTLGGARGNRAGIVDACEVYREVMEACDLFLSDGVRLQDVDPQRWNAPYADARISHVAAIDPGFVWGLEAADVAGLVPSTLIVGFGGEGDRMVDTDFDRSGLSALLPEARLERFDPAYHFSAMPVCKPAGEAILASEADDPVCTDPPGSNRAQIHAAIIDLLAEPLRLN
ncbi:MAG: hypothetical protein KI785_10965 [Devosiaceae bacterium]|nr:hypothetical protein [Devosiaceae bacterium MH13]